MESSPDRLIDEARFFLQPASPAQRQYEALRAFFVEGSPSQDVAQRFGYTPGPFRVLCHHFRRWKPDFFRELKPGPRTQPKKSAVRELVLSMRKQNLSVYDIERGLKDSGSPLSVTAIWEILREEGFPRLPRRQDDQRPDTLRPTRRSPTAGSSRSLRVVSRRSSAACLFFSPRWLAVTFQSWFVRLATPVPRWSLPLRRCCRCWR